jgi:hypothetical protein
MQRITRNPAPAKTSSNTYSSANYCGLWRRNVRDLEILRPEVDSGGYDLALEFKRLTRHVQLKSSFTGAV